MKLKHVLSTFAAAATAVAQQASAALPTTAAPSRGASSGSYIELFQNYAFDLAVLGGLLLGTAALFSVAWNAVAVYGDIQKGRKTFGDLTTHLGMGVLLTVFCIYMVTEASAIL